MAMAAQPNRIDWLLESVNRKGGVLPVVGFSGPRENPTFTVDENSGRASLPVQMVTNDTIFL